MQSSSVLTAAARFPTSVHAVARESQASAEHAHDKQAVVTFNRFCLRVVEAVANRPTRPTWNPDSF